MTNPCKLCHHKRHGENDCRYGRKKCECRGRILKMSEIDKTLFHLFDFKKYREPKYHRTADLRRLTTWEYSKIHINIRKQKPMPDRCEMPGCQKAPAVLSSRDHLYSDNPDDYWYLCSSCHYQYDVKQGLRISMRTVEEIVKNTPIDNNLLISEDDKVNK